MLLRPDHPEVTTMPDLLPIRRLLHDLSGGGALDNVESVLRDRAARDATVTSLTDRLRPPTTNEDHAA
jgi:hypothetical protein